jgi:CRISPR-associated protein Csm5
MKFAEPILIKAEVKSPVFVWDGDTIKPLSFVIDGDLVHVINADRFLQALNGRERQAYLGWIEPILDVLSRIDDQLQKAKEARNDDLRQRLNREKRDKVTDLSLEKFLRERLGKSPAAFVRQAACIAYSVHWSVRPGDDGFRGFIKNAGRQPYVPGTEIKGALRTSLLYALLNDDRRYVVLKREIEQLGQVLRSGRSPKEKIHRLEKVSDEIEGRFFRPASQDDRKKNDAKYDFLRLIRVTDGDLLTTDALRIRALESVGTRRFTKTLSEGIEPGTVFTFRLALADRDAEWALQQLGLADIAHDRLSLDEILKACHQRSAAILDLEAEYFTSAPKIQQQIRDLKTLNRPDAPLLRLGTGQGFLSVTIDRHVRERDKQLYEVIRDGVSMQRRWRTIPNNFPKTRRTISDGRGSPLMLTGWIRISRAG